MMFIFKFDKKEKAYKFERESVKSVKQKCSFEHNHESLSFEAIRKLIQKADEKDI